MQDIHHLISDCSNQINQNITGINYLEKLKYLLIDKFKSIDLNYLKKYVEYDKEQKIGDNNIVVSFKNHPLSSLSIKKIVHNDNLTIIINGLLTLNLYESAGSKKTNNLILNKYMGIVLMKDTLIDETIAKDTMVINILISNNIDN